MAKKKKKKRAKIKCNGDCASCPNVGTKYCEKVKEEKKKRTQKRKLIRKISGK